MRRDEQTEVLRNEWDGEGQTDWAVVPGVGWIQLPLTDWGHLRLIQGVRVNCTGVTCNLALRLSQDVKKDVGHPG